MAARDVRIPEAELIFERGPAPHGVACFGRVAAARYRGGLVAVRTLGGLTPAAFPPSARAALDAEVAALAALRHPNIARLIGTCHHADGALSLVEELADCDAQDLLAALRGRVPADICLKLGLDIARGVAFMHASSQCHSELSAASVLLIKGTAVLAGFGLAERLPGCPAARALAAGALPYAAPENMDSADGNYRRPAGDVFSLGCILFELSTGARPWREQPWSTLAQYRGAVAAGGQRPALDGVEPPALRALIARCWGAPAERPSAAALARELAALHTGAAAAAAQPPQDLPALRRLVDVCRYHGIRPDYVRALRNLEAFDIVVIADDSGSMAAGIKQGDGAVSTRWQELKGIAQVVVELAAALDDDGCDLYFLNRPDARSVRDAAAVAGRFAVEPSGGTPLTQTLARALRDKGLRLADEAPAAGGGAGGGAAAAAAAAMAERAGGAGSAKRVLFLIATDGVPHGGPEKFVAALQRLPDNCYVQLVAVTDDDSVVAWMNQADERVRWVDVNDVRGAGGRRAGRARAPLRSLGHDCACTAPCVYHLTSAPTLFA